MLPLPPLPARPADSHKGSYGRVLVIAGSRGMSGAACLAGLGALRGGAGLVRVAVPQSVLPIVAGYEASYLTASLPDDVEGRISGAARSALEELISANDVVALGPGLGRSRELTSLVARLYRKATVPLVIDADGLNALSDAPEALAYRASSSSLPAAVLTPHPGEFSRLTGLPSGEVQSRRQEVAAEFAARHRVVVVLKGHRTVVSDGERTFVNPTGNAGMATGGTGDVLTGLIAALVAQKMAPFEAARLGVYLHGLAGDLAAAELTPTALIASDLLDYVPLAIEQHSQGAPS